MFDSTFVTRMVGPGPPLVSQPEGTPACHASNYAAPEAAQPLNFPVFSNLCRAQVARREPTHA